MSARWAAFLGSALAAACSSDASDDAAPAPIDACPAPAVLLPDGTCLRPGIAPGKCSAGFAHDGAYGCTPILPSADCPAGRMALPGESTCRPVMPCGAGTWGDIPVDGSTVYVDAATGSDGLGDGTSAKPYKTVGKGFAAAPPGAIVAIAAGSYAEDVVVMGKAARFWGVCPDRVELVGTGKQIMPMQILKSGSGTEVHGMALRGPKSGAGVNGATGVVLDRLWVHDTGQIGIVAVSYVAPIAVRITGTLVEHAKIHGIDVQGGTVDIDASVVRGVVQAGKNDTSFGGIAIQSCDAPLCAQPMPATATLRRVVAERNQAAGLTVVASAVTVEDSVVRGTSPALDQGHGYGMIVQSSCGELVCTKAGAPASLAVRGSVIDGNRNVGVYVRGADLAMERSVVRGTLPSAVDQRFGRGIEAEQQLVCANATSAQCESGARPKLDLRHSLVEHNHNVGIYAYGVDATLDGAVVRDTLPRASDQHFGNGVEILAACSQDGACTFASASHGAVSGTLIEKNQWGGLAVSSSAVAVTHSVVRDTRAGPDKSFGDGVEVSRDYAPASLSLEGVLVANSARAGVAAFGGQVTIKGTTVRCAEFALEGEVHGVPYSFIDAGGNSCGCGDELVTCKVISDGIALPPFSDP
jgi:hypothetical protein